MYKTAPGNGSQSKRVAKAVAAKRSENRHQLFERQREISPEAESTAPLNSASMPAYTGNLTKAQLYYKKFLAWQTNKRANQTTYVKRPFTVAVAKNKFLSPQLPVIPKNYKAFRPPPNLPQLTLNVFGDKTRKGTINEVIVTRSMAARQNKDEADQLNAKTKVIVE